MEEKKKKKQEDKKKKDTAQKKAAEQKTKVPDSAKPSPSAPHPASPSVIPPTVCSSGNGKRAPPSAQQQPAGLRYPPREVPPRFRQHEQKQLLKRGQPLPTGTLPLLPRAQSPPHQPTVPIQQTSTSSGKRHTELPHQSGLGTQYENSHWGLPSANRSDTPATTSSNSRWDQVIICESDTDEWPSISRSESNTVPECSLDADRPTEANSSSTGSSMSTTAGNKPTSMASIQGVPTRGWGAAGEAKTESLSAGARSQQCWGSTNFNLNLNPNANPAAWPVLGHEGAGGPAEVMPAQAISNGGGSAWGNATSPDSQESRPAPSTNVSFSVEPQNLNTDGPNHSKREPLSPIHSLPGWGGPPGGATAPQVNGESGSVWGNGDAKQPSGKETSPWDSVPPNTPGILAPWGRSASGGGGGNGGHGGTWGQSSTGEWGKQHSGDSKGWEEQASTWGRAPASEGSSDSLEGRSRRRERSSSLEAPPPLPRQDLDPRVLCNTGWGQTPVRQHTVWEMDEAERSDHKNDMGTDAWCAPSTTAPESSSPTGSIAPRPDPPGKTEASSPSTTVAPGWGGPVPPASQQPSGWGEQPVTKKPSNVSNNWGDSAAPSASSHPKNGQSWGSEEKSPNWDAPPAKPNLQGWGEAPKSSHGWGNGAPSSSGPSGDWGDPGDGKKNGTVNSSWEGEPTGWKESPRSWGKPPPEVGGAWGDQQRPSVPSQGWAGKSQGSNGAAPASMGSWGGPGSVKQNGSGWGGKQEAAGEPTGWEEPSPPSIRRKMEIDDGTSTWGDPSAYNKTVNMWDRNNPVIQTSPNQSNNNSSSHQAASHHPHHQQPPCQNHVHSVTGNGNNNGSPVDGPAPQPPIRHQIATPGWGELPSIPSKLEPSWGEPATPATTVDNGTSAWGKPPGSCGGWGDGGPEPSGPYSRSSAPPGSAPGKSAPKSMQDGWGGSGDDLGLAAGQWDHDDGEMWNSAASQDSNSSCNSWGNPPKKGPQKGKVPSKQDDSWIMSRLVKQLTDMGFPRDPAEEALKSNNMNLDQAMSALLEKKTELDKRGMGIPDYSNGLVNKSLGCRPSAISKETSSDRSPFLEKDGGLAEDAPTSPFMPSPSLKLPLSSSGHPSQVLGAVSSGLAMQNLNNRQMQSGMFGGSGAAQARAMQQPPPQQAPPPQPSVPPLSSSQPNLRAQVPQFLSPQVQAQLLQFAAKNIGLNPALLTSPINPQQMTLLYQLQQLQMAYQRLQIQQQMMQAQRNISGPLRQQEQQVARTINNMQQQIQQHQRQLVQALLMKQQPPPHSTLSHPGPGKSALDGFPPHPQAPGLADLQTKEPHSSPNSYTPYPLSGLNTNVNVNSLEPPMKDSPQPQSRLSQWTHPNSMDSLSGSSPHLDPNLNKHGAVPPGPSMGHPGKPPMDDSFSPYNMMPNAESPASPLGPPDSWTPGKGAGDKISNGTNVNWPPEFCPGVPWKGLQNIDPETDPNMTPGSVISGPTINTNIQDVNRFLLRDRNGGSSPTSSQTEALPPACDWAVSVYGSSFTLSSSDGDTTGKLSERKSAWSPSPNPHTQASLSHDLWKVPQGPRSTTAPSRPPPGLTNTKPSSTWGGNTLGLAPGWGGSYSSGGTTWSTDSSNRTSSWLVLRNLTPQIDGSTLRTLCMQHGPLITFHLNLTQGNAVVRYSSKEEAAKAQKSLHMCVLGNTTILAEFAGEEDINRFFAQGQSLTPTTSWQANQGTNQTRLGGTGASHAVGHWNSANKAGGDLLWGGVQQYSSLWGPPSGEDARVIGSPTPINTLLPGDLLSGESM